MEVKINSEEDVTGLDLPNGSVQSPKRGRGRPLGSLKKWPKQVRIPGKRGRPRKLVEPSSPVKAPVKVRKPRQTSKKIKRRGRPRKIPLTPEEEEEEDKKKMKSKPKGPRVWKPLGRPRIYPRVEPPVSSTPSEPKGKGRPRKSSKQSKQGAHLRKCNRPPAVSPRPPPAAVGLPRKRGRPSGSFKNGAAKRSASLPTSEGNPEQKVASPTPTKRARQSSGKAEDAAGESQHRGPTKPEPDSSSELTAGEDATEDGKGNIPVANQRKRGRPRRTSQLAAVQGRKGKD